MPYECRQGHDRPQLVIVPREVAFRSEERRLSGNTLVLRCDRWPVLRRYARRACCRSVTPDAIA